jgi:dihydroorotase
MLSDTLFTGVRIVADGVDLLGDLLIRDGAIADFGPRSASRTARRSIQGDGAVLCPGLVDIRVDLGEPGFEYRETIASAAAAASAGGITTLAALPDSEPAIDDPALVHMLITRGRETGAVTILPYGAATRGCRGEELAELGLLREAGAVAFTDGTRAIASSGLMRLAVVLRPRLRRADRAASRGPVARRGGSATEGELAARLRFARHTGGGRGDPGRARHQSRAVDRRRRAFRACLNGGGARTDPPGEGRWAGGDLRYRAAVFRPQRERDRRLPDLRETVAAVAAGG